MKQRLEQKEKQRKRQSMEGRNKFCFDVAYGTIRVAYGTFIKLELREKMDFRMPPRKSDVSKTKT